MMFQYKKYIQNKNQKLTQIFIVNLPAKPAKKSKQVAFENSLRLHTRGIPSAAEELV